MNRLQKAFEIIDKPSMAGTYVNEFERLFSSFTGSKYAIAMCNGTATLHTSLLACGIGNDDEVITTPLTMSSPTIAIMQTGATPVYADVEIETFNISPESITKRINKKTKAVLAVSLFGNPVKSKEISDICKEHGLYYIDDNAQCLLNGYRWYSDIQNYSFQTSKNLTCGEGGTVTTDIIELADSIRQLSNLGYSNVGANSARIDRDQIQSPDFDRHVVLGWNYRMSDLQAACLLDRIDEKDNRKFAYHLYSKVVSKYDFIVQQEYTNHAAWCFAFYFKDISLFKWKLFRKMLIHNGGHPFYAAWKLSYNEPFYNGVYNHCINAEYLQTRMVQLSTHLTAEQALEQSEILDKTLNSWK